MRSVAVLAHSSAGREGRAARVGFAASAFVQSKGEIFRVDVESEEP